MFTNVDVRGVARGRCSRDRCECDGFTRSHTEGHVSGSGVVECGWCCYCGHAPVCHTRADSNIFGRGEIFPVSWQAARPPLLDQSVCHDSDSVILEPEESVLDDVILDEPEDEKDALIDENQHLEQSKVTLLQDVSLLDVSTLNSDLQQRVDILQKLQKLEQENEELKNYIAGKKNLPESLPKLDDRGKSVGHLLPEQKNSGGKSADDRELLPEQENSPRSVSRKGRRNIPRKGSRKCVRKSPRITGQNSSEVSSMCNDPSMVDIGGGVLVKEKQLGKLFNSHSINATKFGRGLLRTVFTPDELEGKCLMRMGRNGTRTPLDPIRVKAVIDYTHAKFNINKHSLKASLSAMLCRTNAGLTQPLSFR